jgi:hypothetical protein
MSLPQPNTGVSEVGPILTSYLDVEGTLIVNGAEFAAESGFVPIPEDPVAFTLTYDTPGTTIPAATAVAVAQTAAAVATTAPTTGAGAYGYTAAQAAAVLASINALVADGLADKNAINALEADVAALREVVVQLTQILITAGLAAS